MVWFARHPFVWAVLLSSCSIEPVNLDGRACDEDGRCLDGYTCVDGICVLARNDGAGAGDPTAGDPLAGDPLAGDPLAGDPLAGDPTAGDPTAGDPLAGDPFAGDPFAGDPFAGDPFAGDPFAGDPFAGDPIAGDPFAGDPFAGDPFAGDDVPVAKPFSLGAAHDAFVSNDEDAGPNSNHGDESGLHIRDIDVRHRVSLIRFDISGLSAGTFANVSFSNYGHDPGSVDVYGIIEALDAFDEDTVTWNNAPGVVNTPAPDTGDPVALDAADLVGPLMSFAAPEQGVRESTSVSQNLADFLNADTDGIVTFLFAPGAADGNAIVRSKESDYAGTLLEGDTY